MTSQSPSGTLPGTRQEGKIGLRFALGAIQGRFWTQKWDPNRLKIETGDFVKSMLPPRRQSSFLDFSHVKMVLKIVQKM